MKVLVYQDVKEVAKAAYAIFKEQLQSNPKSVLGLATGSSPVELYKLMVEGFSKQEISFKEVKTFNLDEYVGKGRQDAQSYFIFMNEHLFKHVDIDYNHVQIPNGKAEDLTLECKRYDDLLSQIPIDFQLLGIGSNGHIGFNEPDTPFDLTTHVVKLNEQTRADNAIFFDDITQVPTHALTMGVASILKSKKIVLIATGKQKAEAVHQMINGPVTTNCPGSILQTHHDVTIICDLHAASLIKDE